MLFVLLFQLFMIEQKCQAASAVTNNYYFGAGGSNSTLLVKLMRSLLKELKKTNVGTCPNGELF